MFRNEVIFLPATYAHYKFGKEVIDLLPQGMQTIIQNNRELYDIGLHGPDILFYYQPYHKVPINRLGYAMHNETAAEFFKKARLIYAENFDNKEAMLAYLLGFASHFALDYMCHSYVEAKIKHSKVSHTAIETSFDRHLMILDGLDPLSNDTTKHLKPTLYNAKIVARFFPSIKKNMMHKVLKSQVFYLRLLIAPNPLKRNSLLNVMKMAGVYNSLKDQLIPLKQNDKLKDSDLRLTKLKDKAKPLYVELADNLFGYLNGQSDLSPKFDKTFEYQDGYENIPVLEYDEELEYEV